MIQVSNGQSHNCKQPKNSNRATNRGNGYVVGIDRHTHRTTSAAIHAAQNYSPKTEDIILCGVGHQTHGNRYQQVGAETTADERTESLKRAGFVKGVYVSTAPKQVIARAGMRDMAAVATTRTPDAIQLSEKLEELEVVAA